MEIKTLIDAQAHLVHCLKELDATGRQGFEGAIAEALTSITGQVFHIAKSGHQDGSDARVDPSNFLRVAMEGKKYGTSSRLGRDELKAKLGEAATGNNPTDLWLLAATRSIDASDREALREEGVRLGVGVMVCDWPHELVELHDLSVLCAAGRAGLLKVLRLTTELEQALSIISKDPGFDHSLDRLMHFLGGSEIGYDAARRQCAAWFEASQFSLANAKSRLGGHNNLKDDGAIVVHRDAVEAALTNWFESASATTMALLGDEGLGKTWAGIDWLNNYISDAGAVPIIVFIKATQIDPTDAFETIAKALCRQTGAHTVAFWRRRLEIWERYGSSGVRILIFLDGLNENFQFRDWAEWLQPMFEDQRRQMYRVLICCWPIWWERTLKGLASLEPTPDVHRVSKFNDAELTTYLNRLGGAQREFAPAVRELMRVPRLSAMVARHASALNESGDITAERVIYEDWKDRIRRGQKTGLGDMEMRSFIADLGVRLRHDIDQTVTRSDVIQALSKDSGDGGIELHQTVEALVAGDWLKSSDKPNQFFVSKSKLPFALGAALFDQIKAADDSDARGQRIAEFLDPLKSHSLGAAILGAATTVALIEPSTDKALIRHLIDVWVDQQNFSQRDFESFWRLAGLDPDLFLRLAEERWLARRGGTFADEVVIKALANASKFDGFGMALRSCLATWLGTIWPDPQVGAIIGQVDANSEESKERSKNTVKALSSWHGSSVSSSWTQIRLSDNEGWSWLSHRAVAIISFMPRARLRDVFAAWAIGRAIMDSPRHSEEVAWVLRVNTEDGSEARKMISALIKEMTVAGEPILIKASEFLEKAASSTIRCQPIEVMELPVERRASPKVSNPAKNWVWSDISNYLRDDTQKSVSCEYAVQQINRCVSELGVADSSANAVLREKASKLVFLLLPENRKIAAESLRVAADQSDVTDQASKSFKLAALTYELMGLEGREQCLRMLSSPGGAWDDHWALFFEPLKIGDVKMASVVSMPPEDIAGWLDYVFQKLDDLNSKETWDELVEMIGPASATAVRYRALKIAAYHKHMPALERFATLSESALPAPEQKTNREIEYWRNRALLEFCNYSPTPDIYPKLAPEAAALILAKHPQDPTALDRFKAWYQDVINQHVLAKSWTHPTYWFSHRKAVRALHNHDPDEFEDWIENWLNLNQEKSIISMVEEFPFMDTVEVLQDSAPDLALRLYDRIVENGRSSIFTFDDSRGRLFSLSKILGSIDHMDKELSKAITDHELAHVVLKAHRADCLSWLFGWIDKLEDGDEVSDVALAYTLLGFCDQSEATDERWMAFATRPPEDPWLRHVFDTARRAYLSNISAKHTVDLFWDAPTHCEALNQISRLSRNADSRLSLWLKAVEDGRAKSDRYRALIWNLSIDQLNADIKRLKEQRGKARFHTRQAFRTMAPWS